MDDTGDLWPHLELERSKVTRPINAETENVLSSEGETDELQTWWSAMICITDIHGDLKVQSSRL